MLCFFIFHPDLSFIEWIKNRDVSDRTCLTGMFGTFVGKFSMFPSAPATWDLDVQSLATAVTLPVSVSMTVEELRKIIADRLGIAAQNQMWHVQGERLKLQDPHDIYDITTWKCQSTSRFAHAIFLSFFVICNIMA